MTDSRSAVAVGLTLAVTSTPQITANWKVAIDQQWTVPVAGRVRTIVHFSKLPVNFSLAAYYNLVRPDWGPNWITRAQMKMMFPK